MVRDVGKAGLQAHHDGFCADFFAPVGSVDVAFRDILRASSKSFARPGISGLRITDDVVPTAGWSGRQTLDQRISWYCETSGTGLVTTDDFCAARGLFVFLDGDICSAH